jgi:hypothetical protein
MQGVSLDHYTFEGEQPTRLNREVERLEGDFQLMPSRNSIGTNHDLILATV